MPTNVEMYDQAIALQQQGDIEAAIGKLEELVAQSPDYALGHAALSVFSSKLENHDRAVAHAKRVAELEANDPFSFVALSLICQKAGRMSEAEDALSQARQVSFPAQRDAGK